MISNIPYIWKLVVAHYKLKKYRISNLTSVNAFTCTYITKKQSLHHSQRYAQFSEKWQNILGNIIQIANLLNSIEDEKL